MFEEIEKLRYEAAKKYADLLMRADLILYAVKHGQYGSVVTEKDAGKLLQEGDLAGRSGRAKNV
jgi:hypothetical protein